MENARPDSRAKRDPAATLHRGPSVIIAAAICGGILATSLSLFSGSCHLPISEEIESVPEHEDARMWCGYGFPHEFLGESREADLDAPDDSSTTLQLFTGPSFRNTDFFPTAAVFDVVAWSALFAAAITFAGPWMSRHRLRRLVIPSIVFTAIAPLFVVRGAEVTNDLGQTDFLAGWPIGWIVFVSEVTPVFHVTRIDEFHLLRAGVCAAAVWLVLVFVASWIPTE